MCLSAAQLLLRYILIGHCLQHINQSVSSNGGSLPITGSFWQNYFYHIKIFLNLGLKVSREQIQILKIQPKRNVPGVS